MAYIAFIAILIGAAGVAGGIEEENTVGTVAAAVIHIGGIIAMAAAKRIEGEVSDDEDDSSDWGGGTVDKPTRSFKGE